MKMLALTFAILIGLTSTSLARCETTTPPQLKTLLSANKCVETKYIDQLLIKEYGEIPLAQGEGILELVAPGIGEVEAEHSLIIYINPTTLTFTIVARFDEDGMSCILTLGDNFRPVPKSGVNI